MSTEPNEPRRVRRVAPKRRSNGADTESTLNLRELLRTLQAVRDGDFSVRLPSDMTGLGGKIADTFNEIVMANEQMAGELARAGENVGKQGQIRHRLTMNRQQGSWGAMERSVNSLIDDLLWPTTEVTRTITAVAK